MPKPSILIVGAGIAGLTLAASLDHSRYNIDMIEKRENIHMPGSAICIPANAAACLNLLGILDDILDHAYTVGKWEIFSHSGKYLYTKHAKSFCQKMPFLCVRRQILHHFLRECCASVTISLNTRIEAITEAYEKVNVILSGGQMKAYDLVIGADGIYSSVRQKVDPLVSVNPLKAFCWRSIVINDAGITSPCFYLDRKAPTQTRM